MSRLVLSSIRSQRSAVPNYRGGCGISTGSKRIEVLGILVLLRLGYSIP